MERSRRDRDDDRSRDRYRDRADDRGGRPFRDRDQDDDRGSSRSSFQYSGRSREAIDKRAKMRGKEFDRFVKDTIKTWVPADGDNCIRILPATWPKPEHYGYDLYVHYGIGPDRQSFLDLAKMKDEPDPISEEYAEALRNGEDRDYIKSLESKRRCGVYLVDRNNEKEGVQFWAMPWTIDADLNKLCVDKRNGEILNIDDPEEGYDIEFTKTGKDTRTRYDGIAIARRSSPLGSRRWLEFAIDNPIPDQLIYYDYEHIAKAFGGAGAHRDRLERGRRSSDREDRSRGRDRDGDDDRGRDRDRDRDERRGDDDRDDSRGSSRGRDRGGDGSSRDRDDDRGGRSRRGRDQPAHSWDSIHDMTMPELESLCESEEALRDINPDKADGREDLADWICEELKLKKTEASSTRRRISNDDSRDEEDESSSRLRRMREERDR